MWTRLLGEAEINEAQVAARIDEQVLWLDAAAPRSEGCV